MMKRLFKILIACMMIMSMAVMVVGCNSSKSSDDNSDYDDYKSNDSVVTSESDAIKIAKDRVQSELEYKCPSGDYFKATISESNADERGGDWEVKITGDMDIYTSEYSSDPYTTKFYVYTCTVTSSGDVNDEECNTY